MDFVSFKNPGGEPLPDDELVLVARGNGSDEAMLELLRRISPFIASKANAFGQTEQDKQDYYQEGIVGFLSAVHAYKPGGKAKFSTFACTCILNRMKNLLRQRSKGSEYMLLPLSQAPQTLEDYQYNPEQEFQAAVEAENILKAISEKLSAYEKTVLVFYLQGKTYSEIGAITDKSAKSVDNAMQRIRRKLSPDGAER